MGWGIGNIGGGTSLNFDVKAYPTEEALLAATPRANTIGIITENKITSWEFSAMEPSAPAEGMVWINIGTSSPVAFNVLKKNAVQVYPIFAKQYVGGAWVDVTAKSYQDGEWAEWVTYLYNAGNEFTSITGGWDVRKWKGESTWQTNEPTLTKNDDSMTYKFVNTSGTSSAASSVCEILKDVDLTNYKTLTVNIDVSVTGKATYLYLLAHDRNATYCFQNYYTRMDILTAGEQSFVGGTFTLDVSAVDKTADIFFMGRTNAANNSCEVTIHEVILN